MSRGLLLPGAADFEFYASDKERRHSLSRYPTRRTIQRRQPLKKPRARLGKTMTKLEVSRRVLRLFTHAHCQHVRGFFWSSLFFFFFAESPKNPPPAGLFIISLVTIHINKALKEFGKAKTHSRPRLCRPAALARLA